MSLLFLCAGLPALGGGVIGTGDGGGRWVGLGHLHPDEVGDRVLEFFSLDVHELPVFGGRAAGAEEDQRGGKKKNVFHKKFQ